MPENLGAFQNLYRPSALHSDNPVYKLAESGRSDRERRHSGR